MNIRIFSMATIVIGFFFITSTSWGARIRLQHSDLCLDVKGASTGHRTKIILYKCGQQENQQFDFIHREKGYFSIIARHSGLCLDVKDERISDGAAIQQYPCMPNQWNQQFSIPQPHGHGFIVNRHSSKCLVSEGTDKDEGAALIQRTCRSLTNQPFIFTID